MTPSDEAGAVVGPVVGAVVGDRVAPPGRTSRRVGVSTDTLGGYREVSR